MTSPNASHEILLDTGTILNHTPITISTPVMGKGTNPHDTIQVIPLVEESRLTSKCNDAILDTPETNRCLLPLEHKTPGSNKFVSCSNVNDAMTTPRSIRWPLFPTLSMTPLSNQQTLDMKHQRLLKMSQSTPANGIFDTLYPSQEKLPRISSSCQSSTANTPAQMMDQRQNLYRVTIGSKQESLGPTAEQVSTILGENGSTDIVPSPYYPEEQIGYGDKGPEKSIPSQTNDTVTTENLVSSNHTVLSPCQEVNRIPHDIYNNDILTDTDVLAAKKMNKLSQNLDSPDSVVLGLQKENQQTPHGNLDFASSIVTQDDPKYWQPEFIKVANMGTYVDIPNIATDERSLKGNGNYQGTFNITPSRELTRRPILGISNVSLSSKIPQNKLKNKNTQLGSTNVTPWLNLYKQQTVLENRDLEGTTNVTSELVTDKILDSNRKPTSNCGSHNIPPPGLIKEKRFTSQEVTSNVTPVLKRKTTSGGSRGLSSSTSTYRRPGIGQSSTTTTPGTCRRPMSTTTDDNSVVMETEDEDIGNDHVSNIRQTCHSDYSRSDQVSLFCTIEYCVSKYDFHARAYGQYLLHIFTDYITYACISYNLHNCFYTVERKQSIDSKVKN